MYIWTGEPIVHWYVDTVSYSETPIHQYIGTGTIFLFFFVSLRFFCFCSPISSSFSLQILSSLSNFSVLFRFASIFSLQVAYFSFIFASFCYFASMWNKRKHAFFRIQANNIFALISIFASEAKTRAHPRYDNPPPPPPRAKVVWNCL